MRTVLNRLRLPILIFIGVLILDQIIKIWVKTSFTYGESRQVLGSFFQLHFIENNGMAFGMELGDGDWAKILLSLFRIVAVFFMGYLLYNWAKKGASKIVLIVMALIMSGAFGNIVDSLAYGKIFSATCGNPRYPVNCREIAAVFPEEGGYAPVLKGEVVDMFYVELINMHKSEAPSWIPEFLFGPDNYFIFFRPIFNLADAAISIGVFLVLLFNRRIFNDPALQ